MRELRPNAPCTAHSSRNAQAQVLGQERGRACGGAAACRERNESERRRAASAPTSSHLEASALGLGSRGTGDARSGESSGRRVRASRRRVAAQ